MKGRKWILAKHFQGSPKEGDLELVEFDVPEIKDGGKLRKFKGGICCGGHLAATYGGELLYLRNFSKLSPPSNFVKRELPFSCGLKSRRHIGYRAVNHGNDNMRRSHQIRR